MPWAISEEPMCHRGEKGRDAVLKKAMRKSGRQESRRREYQGRGWVSAEQT